MIKVYHAPRTRSIRILWLLEELGVPYAIEKVAFAPQPMPFSQATPFGKVPALEDGDVSMFESGAMVEYLLERYGQGRLAPSIANPAERAAFLQWLHYSESTVLGLIAPVIWFVIYRKDAEQNAHIIADAKARAATALEFLEKHIGDKDYLLASGFSAADIMMGFTLGAARNFGMLEERFTRLHAYLARLEARPAYQKVTTL